MKLGIMVMLILFSSTSSVFSQLLPAQNSTMIALSELLRNQNTSISWTDVKNPCSWSGVTCSVNETGSYVTEISLSSKRLVDSSFLPVVCQITTLEALNVSGNSLSSIPDTFFNVCGGIQELKLLNFSNNRVSGILPSFGGGFSSLQSLDLSYNSLSGSVEVQLGELVSLKSLNLSFNSFTGSIPVKLGKFTGLEQLQLVANKFQGPIPAQLFNFKNLTILDLSSNNISGNIPTSLQELHKLEILILSENSLRGEIPLAVTRIGTLKRFAAYQNDFTGQIPAGISKYVTTLDLSYNSLSGSIPDDLLSYPNLQSVDVSNNMLVGSIPAKVSSSLFRLRAGGNSLNGTLLSINFTELEKLQYLDVQKNDLSGPIPPELGSCHRLSFLNLAGNKFSGELPRNLGNLKQLGGLYLQQNNLVGPIPYEITQLTSLLTLNISWNSLNGSIPPSISGLKNLTFLSGKILSLPQTLQFSTLNLSHNHFEGTIPDSLRQTSSLEILDLSGVRPGFSSNVVVDTDGNPLLKALPPASGPVSRHRNGRVGVKIGVEIGALLFVGIVAFLVVLTSRRVFCRAQGHEVQLNNVQLSPARAIESHMLTTNSTHKANIDFTKAMEAVMNPLNLVLSTKFTSYYKVIMPSGRTYFVKKINCSDRIIEPSSHESFGKDLESLGKLNSSNIMIPLAYMLAADSAYLFYEATSKGTLFDVLHRSPGMPLDWVSRHSIAVGLAQGLSFLHGCSSGPILLFDLGSKTVMLKSFKEPQIGDIELCKVIDPSKSTSSLSAVAGSVGYIPPEYAYTMRVTQAGNVYSFGVILLELVTGKQAVSEGTELAKWVSNNTSQPQRWDRILDYSISRASPTVKSQMLRVLRIALACINASSEARPKMKTVLRMLLNAR